MKIVSVANLKGGCGKSNIAVNIAGALAGHQAVELIDADVQGTATQWAEANMLSFPVRHWSIESPRSSPQWIARVLNLRVDWVLIDCPPHLSAAAEAAMGISDLVLIPVFSSGADLRATAQALALVGEARRRRPDKGPACLLVPSRIDRRTASGREIEDALTQFHEPVGPAVGQRTAFIDALSAGQWVGDYAPASEARREIEALARAVERRVS